MLERCSQLAESPTPRVYGAQEVGRLFGSGAVWMLLRAPSCPTWFSRLQISKLRRYRLFASKPKTSPVTLSPSIFYEQALSDQNLTSIQPEKFGNFDSNSFPINILRASSFGSIFCEDPRQSRGRNHNRINILRNSIGKKIATRAVCTICQYRRGPRVRIRTPFGRIGTSFDII